MTGEMDEEIDEWNMHGKEVGRDRGSQLPNWWINSASAAPRGNKHDDAEKAIHLALGPRIADPTQAHPLPLRLSVTFTPDLPAPVIGGSASPRPRPMQPPPAYLVHLGGKISLPLRVYRHGEIFSFLFSPTSPLVKALAVAVVIVLALPLLPL